MKRRELEHVIRAASVISDDEEIIVVGSQAVVGQFEDLADELCISTEADLYPKNYPERADLIDGSIGEGSPFHETFGYYAQGVGPTTSILPSGWEERLIPLRNANMRGVTGYCLEVHDLTIANAIAGREKDTAYLMAVAPLVDPQILVSRLALTEIDEVTRSATAWRLFRTIPGYSRPGYSSIFNPAALDPAAPRARSTRAAPPNRAHRPRWCPPRARGA